MRVADKMAFDQVNRNIARNRSEMAGLQNQAATQKRVTKPSDDPVAASRVLFSKTELKSGEQFIKNLNYARSFLDFTDQSLSELTEVLMRAKELALSQSSDGSSNAQTKIAVAAEIGQLRDQSVQIGNRKLGERFIFGGFKTTTKPFDEGGEYLGDSGEMRIHIDKETFLSMNLPGDVIFLGSGLSKDGQTFASEKQPMSVVELKAQQGQQAPPEQQEQQPEQRGPASLRPPVTAPTTAPAEREAASLEATDGVNVFSTLKKLEVALRAGDKFAVQESLDRIDDALQQVILTRTTLGSRVTTIDQTLNSFHSTGVDTKSTISQLEDADVFQVISDMNKTEGALQATLQTSGKMIQKSLMDFIS
jgi:flagellar hook-associated protein 3 FlgL